MEHISEGHFETIDLEGRLEVLVTDTISALAYTCKKHRS